LTGHIKEQSGNKYQAEPETWSKVAVIILTLNAGGQLPRLLNVINNQSVQPCDVLVIDSSSEDDTLSVAVNSGVRTETIPRDKFDHGATRNFGARLTTSDILVYFTQDSLPADDKLIENLTRSFKEDQTIGATYARQLPWPEAGSIEAFSRLFNYPNSSVVKSITSLQKLGIKTFFISNSCAAYRRSVFEELGGFPEYQIMDEDLVLAARMITDGHKVAYIADAVVYHSHEYTLWQQFSRYFDIGVALNSQRWILKLARSESEGSHFFKEEIKYLWRTKKAHLIPYALVDAVAKYVGYRLGLMETHIPLCLKKKLSMHKHFWNQREKQT